MNFKFFLIIAAMVAALACHSESPTQSPQTGEYFTVRVGSEQFVMYVTDAETIRLATENFQGMNSRFPIGQIATGDGGYNQPWSWHYVPESVRMVEVAIEVCDGTPSYVNGHFNDYSGTGYCPWSARVVRVGR